jgi:hypothetical protein
MEHKTKNDLNDKAEQVVNQIMLYVPNEQGDDQIDPITIVKNFAIEHRNNGRYFTEEDIEKIRSQAYEYGYNAGMNDALRHRKTNL